MPFSGARTRAPEESDLFHIVNDCEERICGVIVSTSALLNSFDQTISLCERLLQDAVCVHRLCSLDDWHYITTATTWALPHTNTSLHDEEGRCLAVDPTLDDQEPKVWEALIGTIGYHRIHPEDRKKLRSAHEKALSGTPSTVNFRAKLDEDYFVKTARLERHDSLSKRLLLVRHHVN